MENSAKDSWVSVTGGTGFAPLHAILQLLQKGYKVKTTHGFSGAIDHRALEKGFRVFRYTLTMLNS